MTFPCFFSTPKATAGGPSIKMLITNIWVAVKGRFQLKINVEIMMRATAATFVETWYRTKLRMF